MPSPGTVVIRADANATIGTGHVMRCLALAQAWMERGGKVRMVSRELPLALLSRLREEEIGIHFINLSREDQDCEQVLSVAADVNASWIVVDAYQFGELYQQRIKNGGHKLLFIDDNGQGTRYCADVVLNQNAHAKPELYKSKEPYTRLLLGPRYALIRREFRSWKGWRRDTPDSAHKILICFGGADLNNLTTKFIEALSLLGTDALEASVVLGPANPHSDVVERAARTSRVRLKILKNAANMPELMAWADLAISAAGSTCWELCLLGLPAAVLVVASNQQEIAGCLSQMGIVSVLEASASPERFAEELSHLIKDRARRKTMSMLGQGLVDGEGAARVIQACFEG
jgi:UDP-2,4-diacetamido-2,4,6-trideoxy-beta-L-altropyranose hydrolase